MVDLNDQRLRRNILCVWFYIMRTVEGREDGAQWDLKSG